LPNNTYFHLIVIVTYVVTQNKLLTNISYDTQIIDVIIRASLLMTKVTSVWTLS